MRKLLTVLAVVVLCGCTQRTLEIDSRQTSSNSGFEQSEAVRSSDFQEFLDETMKYSIAVPGILARKGWHSRTGLSGMTTDHSFWNGHIDDPEEIFIDIYSNTTDASLYSDCNLKTTGVTDFTESSGNGTNAKWGRVEHIDLGDRGDLQPLCIANTVVFPEASAYVFCSKKESKNVAICMTQATDNPSLARQIFETFKWTE